MTELLLDFNANCLGFFFGAALLSFAQLRFQLILFWPIASIFVMGHVKGQTTSFICISCNQTREEKQLSGNPLLGGKVFFTFNNRSL